MAGNLKHCERLASARGGGPGRHHPGGWAVGAAAVAVIAIAATAALLPLPSGVVWAERGPGMEALSPSPWTENQALEWDGLLLSGGTLLGWMGAVIPGAVSDPYDPTPVPYLTAPPTNPRLNQERDLLPQTRQALHSALDGIGIRWFITQGISQDPLSAGTHRPDGRSLSGSYYSAVADISIAGLTTKVPRHRCTPSQARAGKCLTPAQEQQFHRVLRRLRDAGFAAWYRHFYDRRRGIWENEIHAIDPAAPFIKASLRRQMDDYLRGRDGLVGHTTRDAAGPIYPNRAAFCRRAALSASIKGYRPFRSDCIRYQSATKSRYCGR